MAATRMYMAKMSLLMILYRRLVKRAFRKPGVMMLAALAASVSQAPSYAAELTTSNVGTTSSAAATQSEPSDGPQIRLVSHSSQQDRRRLQLTINESVALSLGTPLKRAALANEEIAQVTILSPEQIMVTGKSYGFTQMILWLKDGSEVLFDVRIDLDMTRLLETIAESAPRAEVKVHTVLDTVVLTGRVPDAETAQRVVSLAGIFSDKVQNQMHIAGAHQVLLRTTVAEVTKEVVRALGLNGAAWGTEAFGGSNVGLINPTSLGWLRQMALPAPIGGNGNPFYSAVEAISPAATTPIYFGLPNAQLEMFINALHSDSLIEVLAEPNLVSIAGKSAQFMAGGEYPVPVPTDNGIGIEFRPYGVMLTFTPEIRAGQRINIKVYSEVSEPDFTNAIQISGLVIPALRKRTAETAVELYNGQSFAIAGMLSEEVRGIADKIPGIGDIPVLGALFRSVRYEQGQSELMVFVTVELVEPLNPSQLTYVPGDMQGPPTDWQLYGLGMMKDVRVNREAGQSHTTATTQPAPSAVGSIQGAWGPTAGEELMYGQPN